LDVIGRRMSFSQAATTGGSGRKCGKMAHLKEAKANLWSEIFKFVKCSLWGQPKDEGERLVEGRGKIALRLVVDGNVHFEHLQPMQKVPG